jgi:hypothetical protein
MKIFLFFEKDWEIGRGNIKVTRLYTTQTQSDEKTG